jgi:protein Mpv17
MKSFESMCLASAAALLACSESSAFQSAPALLRPLHHHDHGRGVGRDERIAAATTTQRRAVMIEDPSAASSALDAFFQSQPYLAAFLTCSVKAGTADLLAQKQQQQGKELQQQRQYAPPSMQQSHHQGPHQPFDLSRNLSFVFYGGLVQGMFQQFLFTAIYPVMFGHEHTLFTTLQQVAFDVGVMPFVYLPIVYSMKGLLGASSKHSEPDLQASVRDGLAKLGDDILHKGLLKTYWSIWIPAQCLTFSVVPSHLRVLFVALVSFCWVTILSSISSSAATSDDGAQPPATARPAALVNPSLPSAEGIFQALQRGTEALRQHQQQASPESRRPAFVTVSAAPSPAPRRADRDED